MITFELNGQTFNDGDSFTIVTPELGQLTVTATKQPFGKGTVIALDMGWIKTPLPCTYSKTKVNARLSFYTNGQGYSSPQLAYFCDCGYNVHNHHLTWYDLTIEGSMITAAGLGSHFNQMHNHPLVTKPVTKLTTKTATKLEAEPVVEPVANHRGQFQLF